MSTMRFMSTPTDPKVLPKIFRFDSSPGRAIGQALGAGEWDEKSYQSELMEELPGDEKVYEVKMTRRKTDSNPNPQPEKVGILTHVPFRPS